MDFNESNAYDKLESGNTSQYDSESFGIVKMDHSGKVVDYNQAQSKFTGMQKGTVMGKHFFSEVAPCTNNFMISQKYESSASMDESFDYTFTLKMSPTPVKLRLIKGDKHQYLLVKKAA